MRAAHGFLGRGRSSCVRLPRIWRGVLAPVRAAVVPPVYSHLRRYLESERPVMNRMPVTMGES
jgi:hypothetical protein